MYYELGVESDFDHGEETVYREGSMVEVEKLHAHFEFWGGQHILDSVFCVIVSDELKGMLENLNPSGVAFSEVQVSVSEDFENLSGDATFPDWHWLKVYGEAYRDDFGFRTEPPKHLVVSERVFEILEIIDKSGAEAMVRRAERLTRENRV